MELSKILKSLLEEQKISISKLSKETKVPVQTLHNWLSGMEPRSLRQVKLVAEHFDESIDFLCFGVKKTSEPKLEQYTEEINAGKFEVVLRRIKT